MTKTLPLYVALCENWRSRCYQGSTIRPFHNHPRRPLSGRDKVSPCRLINRKGGQVSSSEGFFTAPFYACAEQALSEALSTVVCEDSPQVRLGGHTGSQHVCCEGKNRKQILPVITRPKMTG